MTKKIIQVNNIELNLVDMRSKKYRKFLVLAVIHETYENNENFNACTRIRKTAFFFCSYNFKENEFNNLL